MAALRPIFPLCPSLQFARTQHHLAQLRTDRRKRRCGCPAGHANAVVVLVKPGQDRHHDLPTATDWTRATDLAIMVVCLVGVCAFTPGVLSAVRASGCLLPLRLGGQAHRVSEPCGQPVAESRCLMPTHTCPWMVGQIEGSAAAIWAGGAPLTAPRPTRLRPALPPLVCVAAVVNKRLKLGVGNRIAGDEECGQEQAVLRHFVVSCHAISLLCAAHDKLTGCHIAPHNVGQAVCPQPDARTGIANIVQRFARRNPFQ